MSIITEFTDLACAKSYLCYIENKALITLHTTRTDHPIHDKKFLCCLLVMNQIDIEISAKNLYINKKLPCHVSYFMVG